MLRCFCLSWLNRRPVFQYVGVQANVVDVQTGHEDITNDFRFTWYPDDGAAVLRTVVPKTYQGTGERLSDELLNDTLRNTRDALVGRETSA